MPHLVHMVCAIIMVLVFIFSTLCMVSLNLMLCHTCDDHNGSQAGVFEHYHIAWKPQLQAPSVPRDRGGGTQYSTPTLSMRSALQ